MSSSSLTTAPSTPILPPSDSAEPVSRPPPRRTYGKGRPRSPSPEPARLPSSPQASPAKGLLNRWETSHTSWHDSLAGLDVGPDEEEEEEDMEAVKREMERRRREARGLVEKDTDASPGAAPERAESLATVIQADVPVANADAAGSLLAVSISTSQTTPTHPISLPPSSPPNKRASSPAFSSQGSTRDSERVPLDAGTSETTESLFPVRNPGRGKPKRIIASDEDSEEDEPPFPRARNTSTAPRAVAPVARVGKRVVLAGDDSDDLDESDDAGGLDLNVHLARVNAEADEREKEEEDERQQAEEKTKRERAWEAAKSTDVGIIFSDDDDMGTSKKGHKKGLNKKDRKIMETDIYRANLARNADWHRPNAERRTVSSWVVNAKQVLQPEATPEPVPELEDINIFSSDNNRSVSGRPYQHPSSPTRGGGGKSNRPEAKHGDAKHGVKTCSSLTDDVNADLSESNDDDQPTALDDLMAQERERLETEKAEEQKKDKLRAHLEAKNAFLASRKALPPPKPKAAADDSDSDLDIIPPDKTTPKHKSEVLVPATARPGPRDPRAAINLAAGAARLTKAQQLTRGYAHKLGPKQQIATETYMVTAAREPNHAGMKFRNGGARPAGMKTGRDEPLSQKAVDKVIFEDHKRQALEESRRRIKIFGQGKKLPEKEVPDYDTLVKMTQGVQGQEEEEEDEDEDAEDEDFAPEDEEELVFSGEEGDAEGADEEREVDAPDRGTTVPTASDSDDDDEATPVIKRRSRPTRVVFDSDDDGAPPSSVQRTPVPASTADNSEPTMGGGEVEGFGGFDLAGFGSGGGSPGFSQLFDQTQMDGSGEAGAFTQMRKEGPGAFLPTQAMLPVVNISDSQVERDNALIAGVIEDEAMERALEMDKPKEMYLNEQGLYTQTKPNNMFSFTPDSRHEEGGADLSPSDELDGTPSGRTQLGTPLNTQARTQTQPHNIESPTQGSRQFTRLRRRASGPVPLASRSPSPEFELEPTQISSAQPTRNAFDLLREGARTKPFSGQYGAGKMAKRGRNEYMEDQAEESDEDNGWGWAKVDEADDEEEVDGDDAFLEELVDDQAVDEDERQRQDELAAQKQREIEAEDDKRREAEARKITEGEHRIKKRGRDFLGSDDEDEDSGKKKRWSRSQRKALRELKTDEGGFLPGESNVFNLTYIQEHESDDDSTGDGTDPTWQLERQRSITPPPKHSARERATALREIVEKNRGRDLDTLEDDLDAELTDIPHFGKSRAIPIDVDRENENDAGFVISRSRSLKRTATVEVDEDGVVITRTSHSVLRSTDSLAAYIQAESQVDRRITSGSGRGSVVRPQLGAAGSSTAGGGSMSSLDGKRPAPMPHRQSTGSSTSSGIMMSRGDRFARD